MLIQKNQCGTELICFAKFWFSVRLEKGRLKMGALLGTDVLLLFLIIKTGIKKASKKENTAIVNTEPGAR